MAGKLRLREIPSLVVSTMLVHHNHLQKSEQIRRRGRLVEVQTARGLVQVANRRLHQVHPRS